jgi:hypothetical protein
MDIGELKLRIFMRPPENPFYVLHFLLASVGIVRDVHHFSLFRSLIISTSRHLQLFKKKHRMPPSSITMEQLSIACCKVDGASPTAQPRVALADAFQPYFSVLTNEVATLESGYDEASDCVDNSLTIFEVLRKLKDSTDTTTRRKRELLLDNADRLISKLQAHYYRAHCQLDEESDDESEISDSNIT